MFKRAIIYYPSDEKLKNKIFKDIAVLRCAEAIKYIDSLELNDSQIETLYTSISNAISESKVSA
ncbi:MAG TPA: hypothetical protein GX723_09820 [Thermoanaerobacterales bacterium]|nr:hypothetical protein [Thermoanaerobacterales bacterium]